MLISSAAMLSSSSLKPRWNSAFLHKRCNMHTRLGDESAVHGEVTRRHVLQAGLAAGLGFGTMTLLETALSTRAAAAAPVYGGHLTILSAAYPEVCDTHLAASHGEMTADSSFTYQVVTV